MYNIPIARTAVTVALDLIEMVTPATMICIIHGIELSQSTEISDAAEEMLKLSFKSGQTVSGSGGSTGIVAVPILLGDAASGLTIESFNTTPASTGTIVTHKVWDWNLRIPFDKIFTPEQRLIIPPSTRATLELISAPTDSVTIGGQILIEMIG
jgi:hypothetical protein